MRRTRAFFSGILAGLHVAVAVALGGCRGSPVEPAETLAIEGFMDLAPGSTAALEMTVDPGLGLAYVAGGMGQTGLVRVDVRDPTAMSGSVLTAAFGGGAAVDPVSHRLGTTDAYGGNFGLFDPSGALADSDPVTGCGGHLAAGAPGIFGVSTQCIDTFAVYDQAAGGVVFETPAGGVGSRPIFNAATGRFYQNRTPRFGNGGRLHALVISPASGSPPFAAADLGTDGWVAGADPSRNRLYFFDEHAALATPPGLHLLDGTTHAPIGPIAVTVSGFALHAAAIDRTYYFGSDSRIRLLDPASGAVLAEVDFKAASGGYSREAFATDGRRAFVTGYNGSLPVRLFAIGRRRE